MAILTKGSAYPMHSVQKAGLDLPIPLTSSHAIEAIGDFVPAILVFADVFARLVILQRKLAVRNRLGL